MKKALISGLLLTVMLAVPIIVIAGPPQPGGGTSPSTAPNLDTNTILWNIVDWMFYLLLVVAALFLIIAAFMFVTASGDPDKIKTARNFVMYAIIGVLVAFAARGLVAFAQRIVGTTTPVI